MRRPDFGDRLAPWGTASSTKTGVACACKQELAANELARVQQRFVDRDLEALLYSSEPVVG